MSDLPSGPLEYRPARRPLQHPDGVDGARSWWWEATIDEWERQSELHWCRRCRHAFVTRIGLKEHRTRVHAS